MVFRSVILFENDFILTIVETLIKFISVLTFLENTLEITLIGLPVFLDWNNTLHYRSECWESAEAENRILSELQGFRSHTTRINYLGVFENAASERYLPLQPWDLTVPPPGSAIEIIISVDSAAIELYKSNVTLHRFIIIFNVIESLLTYLIPFKIRSIIEYKLEPSLLALQSIKVILLCSEYSRELENFVCMSNERESTLFLIPSSFHFFSKKIPKSEENFLKII